MRKFSAIFLAILTVICLSSCGKKQMRNDILGSNDGATYKNEFVGVRCTPGDDWEFMTDEQMVEMNETLISETEKEIASQTGKKADISLEDIPVIYGLYAVGDNGESMTLNFENLLVRGKPDMQPGEYAADGIANMSEAFKDAGYTDLVTEKTEATFAGEKTTAIKLSCNDGEKKMYELIVMKRCDKYMMVLSIASEKEERPSELLAKFERI